MVARQPHKLKVAGSNPASATRISRKIDSTSCKINRSMFMTCAEWRSGLSRWGTYAQRPEVRILFPQQTPFVAPNKLIINNLKFFKYEKSN